MRSTTTALPSRGKFSARASGFARVSRRCARNGCGARSGRSPTATHVARIRRGVGVAGMWYGCGNTSLPNPSTMRVGLKRDGRIALHQGAVDIGQGSATVVTQICARCSWRTDRQLRSYFRRYRHHARLRQDVRITPDFCHRQRRVSGRSRACAKCILRLASACDCARIDSAMASSSSKSAASTANRSSRDFPLDAHGYVIISEATFDPPTSPFDENGQGILTRSMALARTWRKSTWISSWARCVF